MGEIDELFVVDKHPGVRYFGQLENEDQFLHRVIAWFEMRNKYHESLKAQQPEETFVDPLSRAEIAELTDEDRDRMRAVSTHLPAHAVDSEALLLVEWS